MKCNRDFDAFDLRTRLPAVVSKLYKAVNRNGGVAYIHCTAGMGRAPAVALAYMYWIQGYRLNDAHRLLLGKRSCFPKLDAIKSATADIVSFFILFADFIISVISLCCCLAYNRAGIIFFPFQSPPGMQIPVTFPFIFILPFSQFMLSIILTNYIHD